MAAESLSWLPAHSSWSTATAIEALPKEPDPAAWDILVKLAQYQLDLVATIQLRHLRKLYPVRAPRRARLRHAGLPAARHPRGRHTPRLHVSILTAEYGQYMDSPPIDIVAVSAKETKYAV